MQPIQRILVATDFGPASQRAVATASDMAIALDAKVTVAHVLERSTAASPVRRELRAAARRSLEAIATALRARSVDCTCTIGFGEYGDEIVQMADDIGADLVVVGSHGRRGLARALLGSVAEDVVRHSPVPVLAVHGFWFDDRAHAGRALGEELSVLRAWRPVVVAISRGGIVVGAEVAKALGVTLDTLLTRPLEYHGLRFGAICEEGTVRLDPAVTGLAKLRDVHEAMIVNELASLREEVIELRGARWFGDLRKRTVILVADALNEPWAASAAAAVIREAGADRLLIAAPLASDAVLTALEEECAGVAVLHSIPSDFAPSAAYRDFREPPMRVLLEAIHGQSTTAA